MTLLDLFILKKRKKDEVCLLVNASSDARSKLVRNMLALSIKYVVNFVIIVLFDAYAKIKKQNVFCILFKLLRIQQKAWPGDGKDLILIRMHLLIMKMKRLKVCFLISLKLSHFMVF
jgi:hypothetical protein